MAAEGQTLEPPRLVGQFRLEPASGLWAWTDEVYVLHGFAPREVVPTTELVLSHVHAEDRDRTREALEAATRTGEAFSVVHRLLDARGRELTIAVVGRGVREEAAGPFVLEGFVVDLTAVVAERADARASADIRTAAESRGVIEQAKGMVAVLYDVDPDTAFGMMRRTSNDHNVPIRELAREIVAVAHRQDLDRRATVQGLLTPLRTD
ncbi:PAS and ANTAR domain-containing protein [Isoptericola sp. NPDC060185]|uniref:PAS and ANTAR domain-containing protein n=1 Tax=Isoptericola sp. NPDC060185 TaxID=3347065 RepID=UPI00366273E1